MFSIFHYPLTNLFRCLRLIQFMTQNGFCFLNADSSRTTFDLLQKLAIKKTTSRKEHEIYQSSRQSLDHPESQQPILLGHLSTNFHSPSHSLTAIGSNVPVHQYTQNKTVIYLPFIIFEYRNIFSKTVLLPVKLTSNEIPSFLIEQFCKKNRWENKKKTFQRLIQ